jgi:hypothetical protein
VFSVTAERKLINEFAELLNTCQGKVFFVTEEGDRLVADSMLSALVGFATIFTVASKVGLKIECELDEDKRRILEFLKNNNLGQIL